MGFFDYILNNLIRPKRKLPEGKFSNKRVSEDEPKVSYEQALKFNQSLSLGYTPKLDTLEFAIEQYIAGLLQQHEQGEFISSYKALTAICSLNNTKAGRNAKNEDDVIKKVGAIKNTVIINQPSESGGICYRHVAHGNLTGKEEYRLYLSCKREHIAELASKFIDELGDRPYYFKFCADEHAAKIRRSEQFVFYVDGEDGKMNEILQVIESTKRKNPKLFESSKSLNPFMKTLSGYIGYAPDIEGVYKNLRGEKVPVSRSYNSLLSEALEDSFFHAITGVVERDQSLLEKVKGKKLSRAKDYVKTVLGDIVHDRPDLMMKLICNMKQNLITLSRMNSELQIKGIDLSKTKKQDRDIDYIK